MKTRVVWIITAAVLLAALPAGAAKILIPMSPRNLESEGFSLNVKTRDDGTLGFEIARDPAKARWQGRDGHLDVYGADGKIASCIVQAEKKRDRLVYWFAIAPQYLPRSRFTLWEVQTDSTTGEKLLGGGTLYEFRLADFTTPQPEKK
jgi:hypothetical protein